MRRECVSLEHRRRGSSEHQPTDASAPIQLSYLRFDVSGLAVVRGAATAGGYTRST